MFGHFFNMGQMWQVSSVLQDNWWVKWENVEKDQL